MYDAKISSVLNVIAILALVAAVGPKAFGSETTYSRILKLYDQGTTADLSDFDPDVVLSGVLVSRNTPNNLAKMHGITLDLSDSVIGVRKIYGPFPLQHSAAKGREILGNGRYSPLTPFPEANALTSTGSNGCTVRFYYRQVTLDSGKRLLVSKTVVTDRRANCNPSISGDYYGDISNVHYMELPH